MLARRGHKAGVLPASGTDLQGYIAAGRAAACEYLRTLNALRTAMACRRALFNCRGACCILVWNDRSRPLAW